MGRLMKSDMLSWLSRPTYMSADLCFTTRSFFLLLLFVSYPRSSMNDTQSYPATWSEVSEIWKCMSEMWGIPSLYKSEVQKPIFDDLATYIFGMIHHIHKLQAMRALLYGLKTTRTLVHKRFQIGGEFSPTLRKFCILLHCQASQAISKCNLTKLCKTVDSKSC